MDFLDRRVLWPTIRKLSRAAKGQRLVAAPYIGADAAKLFPLRRNDVLVCALTLANARNGTVCPAEVRKLERRGVRIYVRAELHAKVYLLGRAAVVCSANLSNNSTKLDEAGVLLRDRRQVAKIRNWFDSRLGEPLTPEWLKRCAAVYRPPKLAPVPKKGPRPPDAHRLWMLGTRDVTWPSIEESAAEKGLREARSQLRDVRRFTIERIRIAGRERFLEPANPGDLFVQVYTAPDGRTWVYPHGRLLRAKRVRKAPPVHYIYIELPRRIRRRSWADFKRACTGFGLRLGKEVFSSEIRNRVIADELLALTSPGPTRPRSTKRDRRP